MVLATSQALHINVLLGHVSSLMSPACSTWYVQLADSAHVTMLCLLQHDITSDFRFPF